MNTKPILSGSFFWYHRTDVDNFPEYSCDVLLWLNTPTRPETRMGYFMESEIIDGIVVEEASFTLTYNTFCMNTVNSWNDDFEWWCFLPSIE